VADSVQLEWEPSGGLIGFLLERGLSPELSPLENPAPEPDTTPPAPATLQGPTRYNIYREIAALEEAATQSPPASPPAAPTPINPAPLTTLTFVDPLTGLDGRQRCYVVLAIRGDAAQAVEGLPSAPPVCVVPVDDFPPEPPTRLSATPSEGAMTLVWEPNAEPDIAGYLVLRGEAGDATLTPVTDTNVSQESARVEETAR
jgi:hypothetical protein